MTARFAAAFFCTLASLKLRDLHVLAVGRITGFLRKGRQIVLGVEDLQMREQLGTLTHQVGPSPQQVAGLTHPLGIRIGGREVAAAQQPRQLGGIKAIVLGLAAMDGFQVQRVAEHEGDVMRHAQVGHPVPSKHALDADHQAVAKRLQRPQQRLGPGRQVSVENDVAGVVDHAHMHGPGVQVDAAVESMLTLVKPHSWSPSKWTVRWSGNLKHTH
jgi:hypothetical protein